MEILQIVTTCPEKSSAQRIARTLVERRLAGCVQISGPIESHYRWNGQMETSEEWVCTAKTSQQLYSAVVQVIRELHSYQVPEILATKVDASSDYAAWLEGEIDNQ